MARLFTESTLVLASSNQGKLKEIEGLFVAFRVNYPQYCRMGRPRTRRNWHKLRRKRHYQSRLLLLGLRVFLP